MNTWKPVPGYEGIYEVSSTGSIRSVSRELTDCNGFKRHKQGKNICQSVSNKGYNLVCLCNGQQTKEKQVLVHRIVAEAFIPNPENKPQVNHKDGNKLNNDVSNLEWCTASENVQHAVDTRLRIAQRGDQRPSALLSNDQVNKIRRDLRNGTTTLNQIAQELNVSASVIRRAANGERYSCCTEQPIESFRKSKYDENLCDDIVRDRHNNMTIQQIADKYGIPFSSVYAITKRHTMHH